ncbi:MAG: hypothetical protein V2A58_15870 [Planctomycetota bacterium]
MANGARVRILCECGREHFFEQGLEKRVEICTGCGAVLRVPAFEDPEVGVAKIVAKPGKAAPAVESTPGARAAPKTAQTRAAEAKQPPGPKAAPKPKPKPQVPKRKPETLPTPETEAAPAPKREVQGRVCPDCGADVPADIAICDSCGLDLETGRKYGKKGKARGEKIPVPAMMTGHLLGAYAILYVLVALVGGRVGLKVNWVGAFFYAATPFVVVGALLWGRYLAVGLGAAVGILAVLVLSSFTAKVATTGGWFSGLDVALPTALKALAAGVGGFYAAQVAGERYLINGLAAGLAWGLLVNWIARLVFRAGQIHGMDIARLAPTGAVALFYGLVFGAAGAFIWSRFSET